jgi:hypothetical protein
VESSSCKGVAGGDVNKKEDFTTSGNMGRTSVQDEEWKREGAALFFCSCISDCTSCSFSSAVKEIVEDKLFKVEMASSSVSSLGRTAVLVDEGLVRVAFTSDASPLLVKNTPGKEQDDVGDGRQYLELVPVKAMIEEGDQDGVAGSRIVS